MADDPRLPRRKRLRLKGYDYSQSGAYFVTISTRGGSCVFGTVRHGAMCPNDAGRIVASSWLWLESQYPHVALDAFIVMPNHVHGILIIHSPRTIRGEPSSVRQKPLGRLIGAFKTVSTRRINSMRHSPGAPLWHRNYFDHIIRNEDALTSIRDYILTNPERWERRGQIVTTDAGHHRLAVESGQFVHGPFGND